MPAAKSLSSLSSNLVVRACQHAARPASFARVCAACCRRDLQASLAPFRAGKGIGGINLGARVQEVLAIIQVRCPSGWCVLVHGALASDDGAVN